MCLILMPIVNIIDIYIYTVKKLPIYSVQQSYCDLL